MIEREIRFSDTHDDRLFVRLSEQPDRNGEIAILIVFFDRTVAGSILSSINYTYFAFGKQAHYYDLPDYVQQSILEGLLLHDHD